MRNFWKWASEWSAARIGASGAIAWAFVLVGLTNISPWFVIIWPILTCAAICGLAVYLYNTREDD